MPCCSNRDDTRCASLPTARLTNIEGLDAPLWPGNFVLTKSASARVRPTARYDPFEDNRLEFRPSDHDLSGSTSSSLCNPIICAILSHIPALQAIASSITAGN